MSCKGLLIPLLCVAGVTTFVTCGADDSAQLGQRALWKQSLPVPTADALLEIRGIEFHVVKKHEPIVDQFDWLHGVALAWHGDLLFASYGHNTGNENTATEVANYSVSSDGGANWSKPNLIDDGREPDLAVSHGVFLSRDGELWAFHGAFHGRMERVHTRAYSLNQQTGDWTARGVVVNEGFWPMQQPQRMSDGNWIMAGLRVLEGIGKPNNPAAVAISHGDDLLEWDLISIPKPPELSMWGESTVIVNDSRVLNISRFRRPIALMSASTDFGRTWTLMRESNLPMAASKPHAGVLSTGQSCLIGNTTVDNENHRWPLTIAVTDSGGHVFERVYKIRDAIHDGPGESRASAALSYPCAVERAGKLYVGYSNDGGRGANRNSAELAIIPIDAIR